MDKPTVIGVDEVGRGPLAGPVVACACVAMPPHAPWEAQITDSKALTAKKREALAPLIQTHWLWALGEATVEEIDRLNIRNATFLAMRRAIEALWPTLDKAQTYHVMVDGNAAIPHLKLSQTTVVGGDGKVAEIGAASIIAKVHRDALMAALDAQYPGYGWAQNAGYGTATHLAALATRGITPHHRTSFAPVRDILHQQTDASHAA